MQPRPVDLLRPDLVRAMREHPSNDKLPIVEKLVSVLERRSRSRVLMPRFLFPEAEAVLAIDTDIGAMISPGDEFWRRLLVVVAFTGGAKWFKRFFDWHQWIDIERSQAKRWGYVHMYVTSYHYDDELSPADASLNLHDWISFAWVMVELIGDASSSSPDVLAAMNEVYRATLHGLLMHVQALFDRGIAEASSAKTPFSLRKLVRHLEEMEKLPDKELDETRFDKPDKPQFFIDSFPKFVKRRFEALHFDRKSASPFIERKTMFRAVLTRRQLQAGFVAELYGHPRREDGDTSSADLLRERTMKRIQKPASFEVHDEFVRLLEAIFIEQRDEAKSLGKNAQEAVLKGWGAAVDAIEDLFDHFAAHSAFDLTDKGPNYLRTKFPRTLAGERLHDCGVYAVHLASWLLHLEQALGVRHKIKLGLDVRYVALPVHVGLMLRVQLPALPPDPSGLPVGGALICHNAAFHRMDLASLKIADGEWGSLGIDPDPADAKQRLLKLFEEIAASKYISGVDMPVSSKLVIAAGASLSIDAVWKSYFDYAKPPKNIFAKPVTEGPGDLFQFYLAYLAMLIGRSAFFNVTLLNGLWRKDAPKLFRDLALMSRDTGEPDTKSFPVAIYIDKMQALLQEYHHHVTLFDASERRDRDIINALYQTREKDIVSIAARRVFSERAPVPAMSDFRRPFDEITKHLDLCRDFLAKAAGGGKRDALPTPPFMISDIPNRLL